MKRIYIWFTFGFILVVLLATFFAFRDDFAEKSAIIPENDPTKTSRFRDVSSTLRVGVITTPPFLGNPYASLNAPTIFTWSAIFDSLTFVAHDGDARPWLATSWEASSPHTWIFKLREDVLFSNGEKFTSDAVVNAVEYLISTEAQKEVVANMLNSVAGARMIDDYTVEIVTKSPNIMFPREAASLRIVAPEHWRKLGPQKFAQEPHGTGPFIVESWHPSVVRLRAFTDSWRPPHFDRLEILSVPEGQARVQGMLSGQLDIILGGTPDLTARLPAEGHQVIVVPGSGTFSFAFILNPKHPAFDERNIPLTDIRVRQAINYAVDKQAFVDILLDGQTVVPSQPAPRIAFGHDPALQPYPYNPDKARTLLEEAGYADGFPLVIEVLSVGWEAIYERAASDLRAVGIDVQLLTFTLPQYIRAVHTGDFRGQGFIMDFPTAPQMDPMRGMRLHSCLWKVPWLCIEDDQKLIDATMSEFDLAKRLSMTKRLMRIYRDQAYVLNLYEQVNIYGVRKGLKGFEAEGLFIRYDLLRDYPTKTGAN